MPFSSSQAIGFALSPQPPQFHQLLMHHQAASSNTLSRLRNCATVVSWRSASSNPHSSVVNGWLSSWRISESESSFKSSAGPATFSVRYHAIASAGHRISYPTPRTVCISLWLNPSSTFFRR